MFIYKHMEAPDKLQRIVEARMKLKARFEQKMLQTPSVSDNKPRGKGNPNRHGMPVIPVGQTITNKWRCSIWVLSPMLL